MNRLRNIIPEYTDDGVNAAIRDWNLNDVCQQAAYRNAIPKQPRTKQLEYSLTEKIHYDEINTRFSYRTL